MNIQDLRQMEGGADIAAQICIIGSGPAGLTIANELADAGLDVLVVESGDLVEHDSITRLNDIDSVGATRQADQTRVRNRVFGGTSATWSGRCAPLSAHDFSDRPWLAESSWPIPRATLDPYLDRACAHLGLSAVEYEHDLESAFRRARPGSSMDAPPLANLYWQFSKDSANPLDFTRFGPAFLARKPAHARVLLNATVTEVQTNAAGSSVTALEVTSLNGRRATIRPQATVLAAGAIENARILLYSNRQNPEGVGNSNGLVGRYFADHPRCTLAEIDLSAADAIHHRYGLFKHPDRRSNHFFVQGITLHPDVQARHGLLNCAAWMTEHRAADDPWDAAKRLIMRKGSNPLADLGAIFSHPRLLAGGLAGRLLQGKGVQHKLQRLVLDCIVEQEPNPDSRVTLSDRTDNLGMPLSRIDWRITDREKATIVKLGQSIATEFKRLGLPAPRLTDWIREGRLDAADFYDAAHPSGTTRMATTPDKGVVDTNCAVHGVAGLFVAGSSVFPTSGHVNPTLSVVALSIRLADFLKARYASPGVQQGAREKTLEKL